MQLSVPMKELIDLIKTKTANIYERNFSMTAEMDIFIILCLTL